MSARESKNHKTGRRPRNTSGAEGHVRGFSACGSQDPELLALSHPRARCICIHAFNSRELRYSDVSVSRRGIPMRVLARYAR